MPDSFPTYAEWLAGHSDDELVDLLWRLRAFHPGSLGSVSDVAALRRLDATGLAVLHALVAAGAAHDPVGIDAVDEALTELWDAAGTAADARADAETVTAMVHVLASWGLAFGPGLTVSGTGSTTDPGQVKVPSHLPPLFSATTDLPWVLVDGYRCPVPTEELPEVLDALPTRQRRLLDTLELSGGIGHSATLDDPERPLARMISAGLLDRVDAQTARLSPRVAASITGRVVPPAGGDFRARAATETPDQRTDATAVARVVETVRLVADVLEEVGRAPVRPLNAGGVGVREIARLSKALGVDAAVVGDTLVLCRHADLIAVGLPVPAPQDAVGSGDFWTLTERGASYLSAPLSRRWAMLLDGWRHSAHAPWLAKEPSGTDSHLLQESLDAPEAAALRGVIAEAAVIPTGADLWRLRPAVAAVTSDEAVASVVDEGVILGLSAEGQVSSAALALAAVADSEDAEDELTAALAKILPDPVHMLIIQADMTILAPGLLDGDTEARLRTFADVESTGMASVWRVTRQSMQRAVEHGETAAGIEDFLAGMAPDVPQSMWYLVQDTFRTHRPENPVVGSTAASVLTAPDEKSMATIMDTDAAEETGLRLLSPTVAASSVQLSLVVEALEDEGVRISIDGDTGVGRATAMPLLPTVPDPERPVSSREQVADQLAGAVEGFRRSRQAGSNGTDGSGNSADASGHDGETTRVHEPRAIMTALRHAYDSGTSVEISYVDATGSAVHEWISVVTMSPVSIVGVTEAGGQSLQIQPHRVAWVGTPLE
ncbi:helicase-associated domain-containing protein [Corynebacterium sp. AOP40-9SA-29]|uniref:helicase-associated domain-containing protein n=1 Tax=Corynebacterium sp. AOP40-9SA-29 TaxID=3457677 RepID=UPI00403479BC